MLKFKEGQTYICTNAAFKWWTEGKEYNVFNHRGYDVLVMEDNNGSRWTEAELNDSLNEFKLKEEKQMLNLKEGQTYICTKSNRKWWTPGKEYNVFFEYRKQEFAIKDNQGTYWYQDEINMSITEFKLKEETTMTDLIDNQSHYKNQGIEPIVLMRKNFSKEEFAGFLQGNVLKYMLRYKDKNGLEDLNKAKTYLTWLIEEEENA